jgi:hypothetical protein
VSVNDRLLRSIRTMILALGAVVFAYLVCALFVLVFLEGMVQDAQSGRTKLRLLKPRSIRAAMVLFAPLVLAGGITIVAVQPLRPVPGLFRRVVVGAFARLDD